MAALIAENGVHGASWSQWYHNDTSSLARRSRSLGSGLRHRRAACRASYRWGCRDPAEEQRCEPSPGIPRASATIAMSVRCMSNPTCVYA